MFVYLRMHDDEDKKLVCRLFTVLNGRVVEFDGEPCQLLDVIADGVLIKDVIDFEGF